MDPPFVNIHLHVLVESYPIQSTIEKLVYKNSRVRCYLTEKSKRSVAVKCQAKSENKVQ